MLEYWKPKITSHLAEALKNDDEPWIMNLASTDYSSGVDFKALGVPVISPRFLEKKNGTLKLVSSIAKKARGLMTRWLIQERIDSPERISEFRLERYKFCASESTPAAPTFVR